jgi:hypothetical protein
LSQIISKRISDYDFSYRIIRLEQFGFRNKEECINLFVSIHKIYKRRKFNDQLTFLAFLDLSQAYDSWKNTEGLQGKCSLFSYSYD